MKNKQIALYEKYFVENDHTRLDLFQALAEQYNVRSALYGGSFLHITPSFVFPEGVYVDMDKRGKAFFADEAVSDLVNENKQYDEKPDFRFYGQSYTETIPEAEQHFDLLISQWSGFVSLHCTQYLKIGGFLLANNSHGDVSMASIDERYELAAVVNRRKDKHVISTKNLDSYLIPKKNIDITQDYLQEIGRGVAYTKSASMYLLRRIS